MALAEGGVVVFYTDGVTDAINEAEEQFGQAPLTEVIVQKWDLTAQGLIERIDERWLPSLVESLDSTTLPW